MSLPAALINIPNLISLSRLFMAPLFVWLIAAQAYGLCFYLCLVAGATDLIDGLVARALGDQTALGTYLDPIADKILLGTLYVTLGVYDQLPLYLVIMVVFRDFIIFGGALLVLVFNIQFTIRPIMISKINTCFQIAFTLAAFAQLAKFPWAAGNIWHSSYQFLLYGTCGTTVLSGFAYVLKWVREISKETPHHATPTR